MADILRQKLKVYLENNSDSTDKETSAEDNDQLFKVILQYYVVKSYEL